MKKRFPLLMLFGVLILWGCQEEEANELLLEEVEIQEEEEVTNEEEIQDTTWLLQKEIVNGFERCLYEYEEGRLLKMTKRYELYDPIAEEHFIDTTEIFFSYEDDKVTSIQHTNSYEFSYPDADLLIKEYGSDGDLNYEVLFMDYESTNMSAFTITHYYEADPVVQTIFPELDPLANISFASDGNQPILEETSGYLVGHLYPSYFGQMEYDDHPNIYANWAPEIRLWWRWNKNPNNLLSRITQHRIWEYQYEYHESGFPETRRFVSRDEPGGSATDPTVTRYVYILAE